MSKDREASSSVTHLVKVIAQEVANDTFEARLADWEDDYVNVMRVVDSHEESINRAFKEIRMIKSFLLGDTKDIHHSSDYATNHQERAGHAWTAEEDDQLHVEMYHALQEIARKHQRSTTAIAQRVLRNSNRILGN